MKTENFPFEKTLLIAFMGAVIGQAVILFISWIKREIDLYRKKKMLQTDLKNQGEVLKTTEKKLVELRNLLENRDADEFSTSIFQTLQLDVYNSLAKNEIYLIFKKNFTVVVDVYKSIEFIKNHGPFWIYKDYIEKSDRHLFETKDNSDFEFYSETHIGFINNALKNIENHLFTIDIIRQKIKYLTEKNWLQQRI